MEDVYTDVDSGDEQQTGEDTEREAMVQSLKRAFSIYAKSMKTARLEKTISQMKESRMKESFHLGSPVCVYPRPVRITGSQDELVAATELVVSAAYFKCRRMALSGALYEKVRKTPTLWKIV